MIFITSKHTNKMEDMMSLNTSTVKNPFCIKAGKTDTICKICYARNLEKFYGHGVGHIPSYVKNGKILSTKLLSNEELISIIRKFKDKDIIRFHAYGELINIVHLYNYLNIARKSPDKIFALWSKRVDLIKNIKDIKPKNLITIYSTPRIDVMKPIIPDGFDKVFSVYSRNFAKENKIKINCGGKKCNICRSCYKINGTKYINELIKREKKSE